MIAIPHLMPYCPECGEPIQNGRPILLEEGAERFGQLPAETALLDIPVAAGFTCAADLALDVEETSSSE